MPLVNRYGNAVSQHELVRESACEIVKKLTTGVVTPP